jgi:hypothetical protein
LKDAGPAIKEVIREVMDIIITCPNFDACGTKIPPNFFQDGHASSFYWLLTSIRVSEDAAVCLTSPSITKALGNSAEMYQALSPFFERLSRVQILQETDCPDLLFHDDCLYLKIPESAYLYQVPGTDRILTSRLSSLKIGASIACRLLLKPFDKLRRMDVLWEYPYEFESNPLLETFPQRKGFCPQL